MDPVAELQNPDLDKLVLVFEPGATKPLIGDDSFEFREALRSHFADETFQQQIDNRKRTADLIHIIRPDLTIEQIATDLPALYESLTGQKHVDGVGPAERAFQAVDMTLKGAESDFKFWMNERQNNLASSLGTAAEFLTLRGPSRTLVEQVKQVRSENADQAAKDIETLDRGVRKLQVTSDGPWWLPIVDNTAALAASVGQVAGESAAGALVAGPVGAGLAGWDASARLMAASSYRQIKSRGVDHDVADATATVIGYAAGAVDLAGLGTVAGIALKPVVKRATLSALPAITRAIAINFGKAGAATVAGTVEEVVQEGIAVAGENQAYRTQNDRLMAAIGLAREPLRESILAGLEEESTRTLIPLDSPGDIADRLADTAIQSAIGMATLGVFGAGAGAGHTLATLREWDKAGVTREKIQAVTADVEAERTLQKAEPVADVEPFKTEVVDAGGEVLTVFHPADAGLAAGRADLSRYGSGLAFYTDQNRAETESRTMSRGPLERGALLEALRARYPQSVADAAEAVATQGRDAVEPFTEALRAWESDNPTMDANQILDLAESTFTGEPVADRNELVRHYGLEAALPSGGIVQAQIKADKVAHVDSHDQIAQAFTDGAQAVEFDGAWYVKDAATVVVTAKNESQADVAAKNPTGELSFQSVDGTLRATSADGREVGRVRVRIEGQTVKLSDLSTTPEFRRQGVASALVSRVQGQHPGKVLDWGKVDTEDGKVFQDRVRQSLPTWARWGSRIRRAEAQGNELKAEFLRQKADTIADPRALEPEGRPLSAGQLRAVLAKGMPHDEADIAVAILERMAQAGGSTLDGFLGRAVEGVQWVRSVEEVSGAPRQGSSGVALLAGGGRRLIQLVQGRANVSTVLHEMAHVLRPLLSAEDQAAFLKWTGESTWNKSSEERFARGFEQYLGEGHKTGEPAIDAILAKVADWFRLIYDALFTDPSFTVDGKPVVLTPEVRDHYQRIVEGRRGHVAPPAFGKSNVFDEPLFQGMELGPNFEEFAGNPEGAIKKLMAEKAGEVRGAITRPDLGPIDFVYGWQGTQARDYEDGFGLAKIARKHPDMLGEIVTLLREGEAYTKTSQMSRAMVRIGSKKAFVKLEWEDQAKTWLVTAFEETPARGTTRLPGSSDTTWTPFVSGANRSIDPQTGKVKGGTDELFQSDPIDRAGATIEENQKLLGDFRARRAEILAKMSKGKTSDEKRGLEKILDGYLGSFESALAADRQNLEAAKGATKKPDARRQAIQDAVASGRPIPDGWIEPYRTEPWANAELDRRSDLRDHLDQARTFSSLDGYIESILNDRLLEILGNPDNFPTDHVRMVRSGIYLSPEEHEQATHVYAIAHAKTPEQLDKEFAESLTPAKVNQILAGMAQQAYIADKALPRHVLAQVTKSLEGGETNEGEIPRILRTMKNDPRTYRRIAQQGFADLNDLEALALEQEVERVTREQLADEAPPVIKRIEIPTDLNIADALAIRMGTKSRMEWQRKALDADKEHENLERALEILERRADRWTERGEAVQKGDSELDDLEALAVLGRDQMARMRAQFKEFAKEAGGDRTATKDRVVALVASLTKQIRGMAKVKDDARRAYRAQAEEMRKMGVYLSRPASKMVHVDFARVIENNRAQIDPHFRTIKKEELLKLEADWYRAHPDQIPPRKRRGELFGTNLNLWSYDELFAAFEQRKKLEDEGRAAFLAKKLATENRQLNLRSKVLDALYNKGAVLRQEMKEADEAGDTERRRRLAQKYLEWEMEKAKNLRNLNGDRAAKFARGGSSYFLTVSNLADMMDGMADYKGVNHETLWSDPNTAENAYLKETDRRKVKMFHWIRDNGIKLGSLSERVQIPGLEVTYSLDELMTIYVGEKNERKNAALRYGNRIDQEAFSFIDRSKELAWVRKLGDRIIQEYDENKGRLFDTVAEYENFDMAQEENYTPMSRTEVNLEALDAQLQWEAGVASAVRAANIEKGFTKARIEIDEDHQKPIKLGEFAQWLENVGRQEQYIAYTPVIKTLKAVYLESEVKGAISQVHGKGTWQQVDNYIKSLANRYHDRTYSPLDRVMSKLSQNAALAYMAYNIATVLKQVSSFPLFLTHCRLDLLLTSMGKLANPWALLKKVDEKSVQMKTRIGYAELDELRLGGNPVGEGQTAVGTAIKKGLNASETFFRRIADPGMKPMQIVDKLIAAAGWDAAYETAKSKGLLEEAAVEYADWVVGKTQQSSHAKDTAGVMRDNNSLVKALTLFAGPSVKLYNEMVYGTRANIKNKHYLKSLGTVLAIASSGLIFYGLGKGAPPDDEEELKRWLLMGFTNQLPVAGPMVTSILEGYDSGNVVLNQAIESAMKTGTSLTVALNSDDSDSRDRAWPKVFRGTLDIAGLGLGAPVTPVKRLWKAVETGNAWELVGWHGKE